MSGLILFVCQLNMVRSPMAEGLAKKKGLNAVSCGMRPSGSNEADDLMVAVMREVGVDMSAHQPQSLNDVSERVFDRIITFSDDSFEASKAIFKSHPKIELWSIPMPPAGAYDIRAIMDSYRSIRTIISNRIEKMAG
ncbi:MAG: hypothetical protein AAFP97_02325 [Pseudomonadota bacterium]